MKDMKDKVFADKKILITGASSGVGLALTRELLARGGIVYASDRVMLDNAVIAQPLRQRLQFRTLDVTKKEDFQAVIQEIVQTHGRIDFVFNNAGILVTGPTQEMTFNAWEKIVGVNLWGVIYGTQIAYNQMVKQSSGHIINTASTAGVIPVVNSAAYTATKHAVVGLSKALAPEAKQKGVAVTVLVLGLVDTNIFKKRIDLGSIDYDRKIESTPVKKVQPEEIAHMILKGVARRKEMVVVPAVNQLVVLLYRLAPTLVERLVQKFM